MKSNNWTTPPYLDFFDIIQEVSLKKIAKEKAEGLEILKEDNS